MQMSGVQPALMVWAVQILIGAVSPAPADKWFLFGASAPHRRN